MRGSWVGRSGREHVAGSRRARVAGGRAGRRVRVAGGRLIVVGAVLVMASVGQCQLPQPRFPTLGATGSSSAPTAAAAADLPVCGKPDDPAVHRRRAVARQHGTCADEPGADRRLRDRVLRQRPADAAAQRPPHHAGGSARPVTRYAAGSGDRPRSGRTRRDLEAARARARRRPWRPPKAVDVTVLP